MGRNLLAMPEHSSGVQALYLRHTVCSTTSAARMSNGSSTERVYYPAGWSSKLQLSLTNILLRYRVHVMGFTGGKEQEL